MNTQRVRVEILMAIRDRNAEGFKQAEARFYEMLCHEAGGEGPADWPEAWYALVAGVLDRWQQRNPDVVADVVEWITWLRDDARIDSLVEVLDRRARLGDP
jgi:hypothetical protein